MEGKITFLCSWDCWTLILSLLVGKLMQSVRSSFSIGFEMSTLLCKVLCLKSVPAQSLFLKNKQNYKLSLWLSVNLFILIRWKPCARRGYTYIPQNLLLCRNYVLFFFFFSLLLAWFVWSIFIMILANLFSNFTSQK